MGLSHLLHPKLHGTILKSESCRRVDPFALFYLAAAGRSGTFLRVIITTRDTR